MNIKRTCQFLLDKEKDKPDAKLRYRIKWNGNIVAFNVGYRVDIDKWSIETQRCKNNTTHGKKKEQASVINRAISHFEQICEDSFTFFEKEGRVPNVDEFRIEFNKKNGGKVEKSKDFFDILELFTSTVGTQNFWSTVNYNKFRAIKNHLLEFDKDISFAKLSNEYIHNFILHLISKSLINTSIAKYMDYINRFLRWAKVEGYYKGIEFKPKLKGTDGKLKDVIHFTWEELMHLYYFEIPKEKLNLIHLRDVLCFCCFTSL
ncbi:MAG: phage integrase SAM-like domain-containing protein, partial [Bacteroidales bacterium]